MGRFKTRGWIGIDSKPATHISSPSCLHIVYRAMFNLFTDGPEYEKRKKTPFRPTKVTLPELRASIPKHLYEKSTTKAALYISRDVFFAVLFYILAGYIQPLCAYLAYPPVATAIIRWSLWVAYWYWQGIVLAGWWCLGHEAGHGTLSQYSAVNHVVGFTLHTFLFVPYYAWRATHHAHHKATSSIDKDGDWVPRDRSYFGLPAAVVATVADYEDLFEDTPIFTLVRIIAMQLLGWQSYLCANALGSPAHEGKANVNHFSPSSPLFTSRDRNGVVMSNVGLSVMAGILYLYTRQVGFWAMVKLYFVPYLLANHWIVMLTFLHHTDPTVVHYRNAEWTYLRGALATVDRPLLGWVGRFFLHNVSHDHIAHHLFSTIPFYNQPQVTEHIKGVLKDDYNYDSTNTFRALWRSFTECCFIEDDGNMVFYKNRQGKAAREVASQ